MSIPDHKNFYRSFYTITALLDWKHYENYMAQSIYQSSEFWELLTYVKNRPHVTSTAESQPSTEVTANKFTVLILKASLASW